MKIARLELRAFGPFTGQILDLDAGEQGLHLIHGPNEAGKSSALRAITQLLYGFDPRTRDNFLHSYPSMRIGAALRNVTGELLECVRRKGTKNDLRGGDDDTVLDPRMLAQWLGGLDRETFEGMFGIDHPRLVEGGRQIVLGKGNLGQILFAAGAGVVELRILENALKAEAEALFAPRASTRKINKSIAQWKQACKESRDAELPSAEWERRDKILRQTRQQLADVDARLNAARPERARLERMHQAMALVARRKRLVAASVELGNIPALRDTFTEQRLAAVARRSTSDRTARDLEKALIELDTQIAWLQVPESLLARGASIEQLQTDLGSYRKGQHDLPALIARREQLEVDARSILAQMRPDLELSGAAALRFDKRQTAELQNLAILYGKFATQAEQSQSQLEQRSERLRRAVERLGKIKPSPATGPLEAALRRARALASVESERAAISAELARLQAQTLAGLARLGQWTGDLDSLERLNVPAAETVERHEGELQAAQRRLYDLDGQLAKAETRQADLDREIEQLRLEGDVPDETELAKGRRRRDEGWRLVRARWVDGAPEIPREAAFVTDFAPAGSLADAYEKSLRIADEVADRLRREADRVAARAGLVAQRQAIRAELDKLVELRRQAQERSADVVSNWLALWQALGIDPLGPREMRVWLVRQQSLVHEAGAIRKQQSLLAACDERIVAGRRELDQALQDVGETAGAEHESLSSLIDRADRASERLKSIAMERAALESEIAAIELELPGDRLRAERSRAALDDWSSRWRAAVVPLGLPPDATPEQANEVVAMLGQLFDKLKEADGFKERIEGIGREARMFAADVQTQVVSLAPDLEPLPPDQAAEALVGRYRRAATEQGRHETIKKQREKLVEQLEQARRELTEVEGVLDALCQEAGCDDPANLAAVEQASQVARDLRNELGHQNDALGVLAAPASVEDFVAEIELVDPDQLPGQIEGLTTKIRALEEESKMMSDIVAVESKAQHDIDTSTAAGEAAERAQSLVAEIASDAEEFVRLRLASTILREAIERYRKKNQGPVLGWASSLFAELTAGSFHSLRADYDDDGEAVLVGVRPDGQTVAVDGMSEGTADQLYLALRLACVENFLTEKEPVPLIVDDILINFDDERSIATLKVLAELSKRTQVIFFTHHQHLVDLAERHLDGETLFVHRLQGRGTDDTTELGKGESQRKGRRYEDAGTR